MRRNDHLQFRCDFQRLRVETDRLPFPGTTAPGRRSAFPSPTVKAITTATMRPWRSSGKTAIVFRYAGENPNGSVDAIAGIVNWEGNVLGLMPHPERAVREWMGSADGVRFFTSMLKYWRESGAA